MRLFVEQGYHNVSIPAIVRASGVSTGAIYHYFDSKENLARYIHDETLSEFQRMLAERLVGKSGTCESLQCFAELLMDITENKPLMMEYMLFMKHGEFLSNVEPICYSEPFRWIEQVVKGGMENGEVKKGDVLVSAASYTGVLFQCIELRLNGVMTVPLGEVAAQVIGNAWRAIEA